MLASLWQISYCSLKVAAYDYVLLTDPGQKTFTKKKLHIVISGTLCPSIYKGVSQASNVDYEKRKKQ
jgi:hypothetical protein